MRPSLFHSFDVFASYTKCHHRKAGRQFVNHLARVVHRHAVDVADFVLFLTANRIIVYPDRTMEPLGTWAGILGVA